MIKYSKEQLMNAAKVVIKAKALNDQRYFQIVFALSLRTSTAPAIVERKILQLSLTGQC